MVFIILENWNYQLKNKSIDFVFYIKLIRTFSVLTDGTKNQNGYLNYMCFADLLIRLDNSCIVIVYQTIY